MQVIENRMVVDGEWIHTDPVEHHEEQETGTGYENITTGEFISENDALDYARESADQEEMTDVEFVKWFFSGNWVKR